MEPPNQITKSVMEGFDNLLLTQTQFMPQKKKVFLEDNIKYGKEIDRDYNKLQDILDNLQGKIDKIIKSQEDDFMIAYREQMTDVQKELKNMKRKIDEEALRQKADEKKRILEEERDYFKEEALRLDKLCQEQLRTIEEIKFKLKITLEEKQYYEGFVIDSKKENKALKYELLYLYKQKSEEQKVGTRIGQIGDVGERNNMKKILEIRPDIRPMTQDGTYANSTKDEIGEGSKRGFSSVKKTLKTQLSSKFQDQGSSLHDLYKRELSSQQQSRQNQDMQQIEEISKSNVIQDLKQQLQKEKQLTQQLKVELSQQNCQRGELEQILLECVAETKKEVHSRQCLQKQVLNHRYLDLIHQEGGINFSQFTHTDKISLLRKYIGSEEFLDQLYQITFNNQLQISSSLKLNEKWKMDADEATKKFNHFKTFKFKHITSQPILKTSLIKKNEREIVSISNNFTEKTKGLIDKIIKS
ncbi:unnamed protein product [Paramecium pentaurelia]|uniref:Uncharacterized protein n=1 Tax=Paramecium pentaurelia TaxID=43138 RepID=A0A8S1V6V0_9CILI|nr:unnamed protein product [Paramecium pentaurelia]